MVNGDTMKVTNETHVFKAETNIGNFSIDLTDDEAEVLTQVVSQPLTDPSKTLFLKVLLSGAKEAAIHRISLTRKDDDD